MKFHLLLPRVEPEKVEVPTRCPYSGCGGRRLRWHQDVPKAIRDTKYEQVFAHRYQCLRVQADLSSVSVRSKSSANVLDAGNGCRWA